LTLPDNMRKSVDKEAIMDRPAVSEDVEAMLDLAERRREQYQAHAPTLQKPAPKARDAQRPYFHQLVVVVCGLSDWTHLRVESIYVPLGAQRVRGRVSAETIGGGGRESNPPTGDYPAHRF
jgi:hypothetical protein